MSVGFSELTSPVGRLRLALCDGALIRLEFADETTAPAAWRRDDDALAPACAQLRA